MMLQNDLLRLDLTDDQAEQRAYLITSILGKGNESSQARVGPLKWWWGTEVELAWACLRQVEEQTIGLLSTDELVTRAAAAAAQQRRSSGSS